MAPQVTCRNQKFLSEKKSNSTFFGNFPKNTPLNSQDLEISEKIAKKCPKNSEKIAIKVSPNGL